ncbi:NAD-dependent epimerase/dehydratase family protein [Sphingomonas bacterium]|uniref:NAD-dependent epimerase/dehydratase family protein n=1 Tax=Sphingomonas bacterium TaxID=1895847 RepID=UPI001576CA5A|nr:NAD(P)-dependent oxidoreductase [Sphingomonas bacterium]
MDPTRTLLVIGGSGFFGKSILDAFGRGLLAPFGIGRVIAAARRPETLRATAPELLSAGVELVALDALTADALPRVDVIVHAATTSDARRHAADPLGERAAIVEQAERFAVLAARCCPAARIVYASSGAVYGTQPAGVAALAEDAPFGDAVGLPAYKRDYAVAKRLAEAAIARGGAEQGLAVSIARAFAFVGPYLPRDQHFAIGQFLADGLAGRPIAVRAGTPVYRSYLHADELVRWLLTIADSATPACPVYNIGSDEAVEMADLAGRIARRFGVPAIVPSRAGGPVDRYVPCTARIARELGLVAPSLDAALDATVAWLTRWPALLDQVA